MKKNNDYLWLLGLVLIFFSCESDWGKYGGYKMDYDSKLEYYIVLDKGEAIYGSNSEDIKKGILIKYFRSTNKIDSLWLGKGGIIIESFVDNKKIVFDSQYILVPQKPLGSICECNYSCLVKKYSNVNELPTYERCKEALKISTFYQYWIIDKVQDNVYGPYSKEEYLIKRKELGVPEELRLVFEE